MKHRIAALLAALTCLTAIGFGPAATPAAADSGLVQDPVGGHWYQRIDTSMSWHAAVDRSAAAGGHLVTIGSASENAFVSELSEGETWLGATDEATEGTWLWVTGEPLSYTNWLEGEPNDADGEDSGWMEGSGGWNDIPSDEEATFVIEWDGAPPAIPDPNFAKCITDELSKDAGSPITDEEMAAITELLCIDRDISLITGAEKLINVTTLELDNNQVSDLGPLGSLTALTELSVPANRIDDIGPLAGLVNLVQLNLDYNSIGDVGALSGLTELTHVRLNNNAIDHLPPLEPLPALVELLVDDQRLTIEPAEVGTPFSGLPRDITGDVPPLTLPAGATFADEAITYSAPGRYEISFNLTGSDPNRSFSGSFQQTVVADLDTPVTVPDANFRKAITDELGLAADAPLTTGDMARVDSLFCEGCGIADMTGAQTLVALQDLVLGGNQISTVVLPADLSRLSHLDLSRNQLSTLQLPAGMSDLEYLDLWGNQLTSLALPAGLTNLEVLFVNENQLSTLAIPNEATKLVVLGASDNQLTSINLPNTGSNLISIDLSGNRLSSISLPSGLGSLEDLYLGDNRFTSVTLPSGLGNLDTLELAYNQLSTLSLPTGLTSLRELQLSGNRLSDLSSLAGLSSLSDVTAYEQEIQLPPAKIGVPFPFVVKDMHGTAVPLDVPDGVTYADGALTYNEPGSFEIPFSATDDTQSFEGTIYQVTSTPLTLSASSSATSGDVKVRVTSTASTPIVGAFVAVPGLTDEPPTGGDGFVGFALQPGATQEFTVAAGLSCGASLTIWGGVEDFPTVVKATTKRVCAVTGSTPTINDTTPTVDQVLTANPSVWGPAPVTLKYQWHRVNSTGTKTAITGATNATYKVQAADVGFTLRVAVTGSKTNYTSSTKWSAATTAVARANLTATPTPTIAGTAKVDRTLTATAGVWAPAPVTLKYQWYRVNSSGTQTAITGATAAIYKVPAADVGYKLRVSVTGSKAGYTNVTKWSSVTAAVVKATLTPTPTPTITGTTKVDQTMKADAGIWGPTPVTLKYQWYRVNSSGTQTAITGATAATYKAQAADVGFTLRVAVTASKAGYNNVTKWSSVTAAVVKATLTPTPTPTITGTTKVDQTMKANPGIWGPTPVTLKYQWYRVNSSGTQTAITGATAATYKVPAADVGYKLRVSVTGSKAGYTNVTKWSSVTAAVVKATLTPTPTPTITGTLKVASTLTAVPGEWGPAPVSLAYQWYRVNSAGTKTAISGATKATYVLTSTDRGQGITVRVTGSKSGYVSVAKDAVTTAPVA